MTPHRVTFFQVANLEEYQHYKDRSPPWIKLHAKTLESYDFSRSQDAKQGAPHVDLAAGKSHWEQSPVRSGMGRRSH